MSTIELLRDSVTGKLQRDTVTGKLMVHDTNPMGLDCEFCDPEKTPKYITLAVSGLNDCSDCFLWEGVLKHWKSYGLAAVLNTCVIILEQDPLAPCVWEKNYISGDFGTLVYYAYPDCVSEQSEHTLSELYFRVVKTAVDKLTIGISARAPLATAYFNHAYDYQEAGGQGKEAVIVDCINVVTLSNVLVCGDPGVSCSDGQVTLVEGIGEHYAPPSVQYQRRQPTSDILAQWSPGVSNHAAVDDPYNIPDDDSTYTSTNVQAEKDLFGFTALAVPADSIITNVKVLGRFKRIDAGGDTIIRELLKVNGVIYAGLQQQLVLGAYFAKEHAWTLNPATGLAWTIADVNGSGSNPLEAFGYEALGLSKTVRCTQVYVEVNYEYHW